VTSEYWATVESRFTGTLDRLTRPKMHTTMRSGPGGSGDGLQLGDAVGGLLAVAYRQGPKRGLHRLDSRAERAVAQLG
jgi:hypothetical protein